MNRRTTMESRGFPRCRREIVKRAGAFGVSLCLLVTFGIGETSATPAPPYLLSWGSNGSGNGQFAIAQGLAVDNDNNVYVADTGNDRIQKFSSTGAYLGQWGSTGGANGQFNGPRDVLVTGNDVYVVDTGNNRIQRFTTGGAYVSQWGSGGSGNGQFSTPSGIAVDVLGNFYVTDTNNHRVETFDANGGYTGQWGSSGTGNGQFGIVYGIATDGGNPGHVYVTDITLNRVQEFTSAGGYLTQWGAPGSGNGQFNGPRFIAVDSGLVMVVDINNERVQEFDTSGGYLTQWGSLATSVTDNGKFVDPVGVAVGSYGYVYISDASTDRVQKFGINAVDLVCSAAGGTCIESLTPVDASNSPVVSVGNNESITFEVSETCGQAPCSGSCTTTGIGHPAGATWPSIANPVASPSRTIIGPFNTPGVYTFTASCSPGVAGRVMVGSPPSTNSYCIVGLGNGSNYAWWIDLGGDNDPTQPTAPGDPFETNVGPTGINETAVNLAGDFVTSIMASPHSAPTGTTATHPTGSNCFTITNSNNTGFNLWVAAPGSGTPLVSPCAVTSSGCTYNPTITLVPSPLKPVPAMGRVGGVILIAAFLLAVTVLVRRRSGIAAASRAAG